MAIQDDNKNFTNGGMDQDSSPENVAPNDYVSATDGRTTGTGGKQLGYFTNIEANIALSGSLPPGINRIIGGGEFDDIGAILAYRFNTAGECQLLLYTASTQSYSILYTDSATAALLPLNPQKVVTAILVNKTFAVWWAEDLEVGYTNLNTLKSGAYQTVSTFTLIPGSAYANGTYPGVALTGGAGSGAIGTVTVAGGLVTRVNITSYGVNYSVGDVLTGFIPSGSGWSLTITATVLWEDFSLLKPQCLIPPTGVYGSDAGTPANYLFSNLGQFAVQYVNDDFNYSAWSTWSKRLTPYQENTPTLGSNVSQNNYIVVSVNIGTVRATVINVACRFGLNIFYNIKSVTRAYVTALPNTTVNVATEVNEAYDPATNLYSFAFYNNTINIPIAVEESSLTYDYIWPANSGALINGNIIGLADWKTLYARPSTSVTIAAVGYNPNIGIPAGTYPDPLRAAGNFPGASGSGAGGHKRIMSITIGGTPHTNDQIITITADIRNSNATINRTYIVPLALNGNLAGVIAAYIVFFPSSSYVLNGDGTYTITWTDAPYYGLIQFSVNLYFSGATVANSIPSVLDNSQGQLALSYRDYKARFLPLCTDRGYIWQSASYAQVLGNATRLSWTINDEDAPEGAVDYQWLTTVPPVLKIVDTIATILIFKGGWNASSNTPSLAVNSGNVGDTYQVTTPASPAASPYHNLGHNDTYNTGDYIVDNALSYDVLGNDFGNLAAVPPALLAFSLNALKLYDTDYQQVGVNTLLSYDFTPGDRCTLHYWIGTAGGIATFTIVPGSGYTNGTYTNVALTGGTGTGALANITVAGGLVTAVTLSVTGGGYTPGDSLTGTVPAGSGWSITIGTTTAEGINYFNNPCIDLAVLGYDAGSYILKVENSAALTYSGGHILYNGNQIDVRNIFLRIYSPALANQTSQTTSQATTVWYEIGERFPVVNGKHSVLSGNITDGGVYYKTRQFLDGILPYTNPPVDVLATDLSYSDFYTSDFWSAGRTRTYYDELEKTTQAASIITSQNYIIGSRNNGLNRFYPSTIYGEGNGQTSSAQGEIQIMWQRGNVLVILQALGVFYCPVNITYTQINDGTTQESISNALLNNGRYASESVGIGALKKSFCTRYDRAYFVSPQFSEPYEIDVEAGVRPYSGKMSKFFKSIIQVSVQLGKDIGQFYNQFYEEVFLYIESGSDILIYFPFDLADWNPNDSYVLVPSDVTATTNGAHSTVSYNSATGIATYTPAANYVGNDVATFTFNPGVTKNVCLNWTTGSGNVNAFSFMPLTGVPLTTVEVSNIIGVSGNDYPVAISITGSTGLGYSINGGAFTSSPGTVNSGDNVQVRVTSSGSLNTLTSCTLTIDSQSSTFDVTTRVAGNFTAYAQYGGVIDKILPGTGSGVPAGYNPCTLTPGQALSAAYTTLTAGTYQMVMDGMPTSPGHTYVVMTVNSVNVGSPQLFTGPRAYTFTLGSPASDPTPVEFTLILM